MVEKWTAAQQATLTTTISWKTSDYNFKLARYSCIILLYW